MALDENQIAIIVANPLDHAPYHDFGKHRRRLQESDEARDQDIVMLLVLLFCSTAGSRLVTPSNRGFSDFLYDLCMRLFDRKVDMEIFKPLIDVIVTDSPDIDIWAATLDLIELMEGATNNPALDATRAHQSLYTLGGIIYCDLSPDNIIITNSETTVDGFKGMLMDPDPAKVMDGAARSGAQQPTGMTEFIAVEVLRRGEHTYRHDLESFLYVFLWMCARAAWTKPNLGGEERAPENSLLLRWAKGDFKAIADTKLFHMTPNSFPDVLAEFPRACHSVKPLC
ncbi:hypothetical protein F5Y14DRAFT_465091 [Nemania sp. NC0429]|nr:hypothetical protein F5Y14DRAFT_465091 [Nemania sp. NC0429]